MRHYRYLFRAQGLRPCCCARKGAILKGWYVYAQLLLLHRNLSSCHQLHHTKHTRASFLMTLVSCCLQLDSAVQSMVSRTTATPGSSLCILQTRPSTFPLHSAGSSQTSRQCSIRSKPGLTCMDRLGQLHLGSSLAASRHTIGIGRSRIAAPADIKVEGA
jgi:hypothetical protein